MIMVIKMIDSTNHEAVKLALKLKQKKYRNDLNKFLIEGHHLIDEASELGLLETVFSLAPIQREDVKSYQVSKAVFKQLSDVIAPQGMIGICAKPNASELSDRILLLDGIQDPGNLGTILRSAVAFGFKTIVAENTCDFYNEKVIRGSQGAIFKVNIINTKILEFLNENPDYDIYGTDVSTGEKLSHINFTNRKIMLILGNEGSGVREELKSKADANIHIEMENTESLNVSIAASIIMYEIFKR